MAASKETYYALFDAHVQGINANGKDIEATHVTIAGLELQLETERNRLKALRGSRKTQFVQLKGLRDIIRKMEDIEVAEERAAQDEATE